jgi:hypothetical protein
LLAPPPPPPKQRIIQKASLLGGKIEQSAIDKIPFPVRLLSSVRDPDPQDRYVFWPPDPEPLVRGTNPDPSHLPFL